MLTDQSSRCPTCWQRCNYRPQRSWGKIIFSEACVKNSFYRGGGVHGRGGHVWRGACMAGGCAWPGGHAWVGVCMAGGACMGGGVHGRGGHAWVGVCVAGGHAWWGVCVVGGMNGRGACVAGGHAWQGGVHGRGCAWQILRDIVNERAVRILLECILVYS